MCVHCPYDSIYIFNLYNQVNEQLAVLCFSIFNIKILYSNHVLCIAVPNTKTGQIQFFTDKILMALQ
jgi:translation initiation factor RLI1